MASIKEHVSDCQAELGKGWDCVHHWLDEYAKIYWPWMGHRTHRHHKEGIEECRAMWGDDGARAAEIHILKDEGNIPSREEINKKYGVTNDSEK